MISNIILIVLTLAIGFFISPFILWVILNRKITLWQTIKLTYIINALNKLFLTGSGYLAMGWKLKNESFPITRSLSSFAIFELISILPWLISGFYFGARITIETPGFFIVILILIFVFSIYKGKTILSLFKNVLTYFKEIRIDFLVIIPLLITNVALGIIYYFLLFNLFGFSLRFPDILRIVSVSFTLGYLSIFPAGLGAKEGGLIYLLAGEGIPLPSSISIAITDRVLMTSFYAFFGFLFGAKIIKEEVRKRFTVKKKAKLNKMG